MKPQDQSWLGEVAAANGWVARHAVPELAAVTIAQAWRLIGEAYGVTDQQIADALCRRYGMARALMQAADPLFRDKIPAALRERRLICALGGDEHSVKVATANPHDHETVSLLAFSMGMSVEMVVATPAEIEAINRTPALSSVERTLLAGHTKERPGDRKSINDIVRLGNKILVQALEQGVSDIHIQPKGDGGVVRMRLDGVMQNRADLSADVMERLQMRIKVVAGMDPTSTLLPQDGHHKLQHRGRMRDIRVSSVPASGREKIVMRLLGAQSCQTLEATGIQGQELTQLRALLTQPQGLIIITGPTGSGKTTTLYSALAELNDASVNITTVEDPVEIHMDDLTQIEVNTKAGLDFATALRSVLRQDPDILLIGEIRDRETARIALQAAITGHIVLASLHTVDAVGAVPRLLDLGVEPSLLSEALIGAQAQRLVRRLCASCREAESTAGLHGPYLRQRLGQTHFVQGTGCLACNHSGYAGRMPVCQVFTVTPDVRSLLESRAPLTQLREMASAQGMRDLRDSALDLVCAGLTSLAEVERVLGPMEVGLAS